MNNDGFFEALLSIVQEIPEGTGVIRANHPSGTTFVYKDETEIVGIIHVQRTGTFIVAVRSDRQRQGIATELLKTAQESALVKPDYARTTYSLDGEFFINSFVVSNGK